MNRVLRRTWMSALALAATALFAGCVAETGDTSTAGDANERTGETSNALIKVGNPPPPVGTVTAPTSTIQDDIKCVPGKFELNCACVTQDSHCVGIDDLCRIGGSMAVFQENHYWGCTISTI